MAQPPQGMSEEDYEAIEAAVTETVRGRWFLGEFARRNRSGEMGAILAAIGRIEGSVDALGSAPLMLPADPSVRLLMQRVREISRRLDGLAGAMRLAGADERFAAAVEDEGRAVAGMMRVPSPQQQAVKAVPGTADVVPQPRVLSGSLPVPKAEPPPVPSPEPVPAIAPALPAPPTRPDARLRHLNDIDRLSMAEKLALFA